METVSCPSNESTSNVNKKMPLHVEAYAYISASFSFIPIMASEDIIFYYFFTNLSFWLPCQPIKLRGFDKTDMFGRGLFKEHFCVILSKYL